MPRVARKGRASRSRGTDLPINGPDQNGRTTLMNAHANCMPLVALLLDGKADVDARDKNGMTALMHAAKGGTSGLHSCFFEHADAGLLDIQSAAARWPEHSHQGYDENAANMSKDPSKSSMRSASSRQTVLSKATTVLAALNSARRKDSRFIAEAIRFYTLKALRSWTTCCRVSSTVPLRSNAVFSRYSCARSRSAKKCWV